jgi:SPP1 family holin
MKRKIEKGTIVRTVVLAVALVNQGLTISGRNPLPFTNEEVGQGVSMVLTVGASLWAWWKNNSFTQAAIAADEWMHRK